MVGSRLQPSPTRPGRHLAKFTGSAFDCPQLAVPPAEGRLLKFSSRLLSASGRALALLVAIGGAATACSSFDSEPVASGPATDAASPGTDGGDGGFPPVQGTPGQDSGSDAGRDANPGAWSPKDIPGLAVWLDSTTGVTFDGSENVTAWLDQSANQNKAGPTAPCIAPTRAANSLNGHDTIAFSGAGRTCVVVADAPSLQFGMSDFAIFVVARYTNVPMLGGTNSLAYFWRKKDDGVGGVVFIGSGGNAGDTRLQLSAGINGFTTGATTGLNDNSFRRLGGTRRGVDLEVWVDGNPESKKTVTVEDVSQVGQPVCLGATLAFNNLSSMIGNLAEVVAVKGTLSDAQITQLDGYFKAKHGL